MTEVDPTLTHDSYGTITFSRQHGPPRNVFGSPTTHTDVIRLDINTAYIIRTTNDDQILSHKPVFTGYFTHAQLADALFFMSSGPPTPITIQFVQGDDRIRDEPPRRDPSILLDTDLQRILADLMTQCDELSDLTKGPAKRKAQGIKAALQNQLPFLASRMRETHYRTAQEAKQEFTAYINRTPQPSRSQSPHPGRQPPHASPPTRSPGGVTPMPSPIHRTILPRITASGRRQGFYRLVSYVDTNVTNPTALRGLPVPPTKQTDLPVGSLLISATPSGSARHHQFQWRYAIIPIQNEPINWSDPVPHLRFLDFRDAVSTEILQLPPPPPPDKVSFTLHPRQPPLPPRQNHQRESLPPNPRIHAGPPRAPPPPVPLPKRGFHPCGGHRHPHLPPIGRRLILRSLGHAPRPPIHPSLPFLSPQQPHHHPLPHHRI